MIDCYAFCIKRIRVNTMKQTTADFADDILALRAKGESYEGIARWLAVHKGFVVSGVAVRAFVVKQENIAASERLKK